MHGPQHIGRGLLCNNAVLLALYLRREQLYLRFPIGDSMKKEGRNAEGFIRSAQTFAIWIRNSDSLWSR